MNSGETQIFGLCDIHIVTYICVHEREWERERENAFRISTFHYNGLGKMSATSFLIIMQNSQGYITIKLCFLCQFE